MTYKIGRRVPDGWSELRWCIIRIADNQIVIHRDHEHDCQELLSVIEILEPPQPTPLTQEAINKRPPNCEPQGLFRKLIWRAARREGML